LIGYILRKRVRRGAVLLDKQNSGWEENVRVDILNMSCADNCVLGQLYGNYFTGSVQLRLHGSRATRTHGFSLLWRNGSWEKLREIWTTEITERRQAA